MTHGPRTGHWIGLVIMVLMLSLGIWLGVARFMECRRIGGAWWYCLGQ